MLHTLFFRELRRAWLGHAGLLVAVIATITLLERVFSRGEPPNPEDELFLSRALLAGLVISGLVSGERCFSKTFKEMRYPFLLTLPRRRGAIWLSYLGGRLAGALTALPVLLLRWIVVPRPDEMSGPLLISALTAYLVYFLGGAVLALALNKELLVYLLGFPFLTTLLLLLTSSAAYGFDPVVRAGSLQENHRFLLDTAAGSLLLSLIWTAVAQRAFRRGEFHVGSRMAQTLAEAGLASIAFAVLTVLTFSSTNLAAFRDEWQPVSPGAGFRTPYPNSTRPVSANGRFLFIYQQLHERPLFTRLAVVDLKTGNLSGWLERPGIHQVSWATSGAVLNVLATDNTPMDCLGLPCKGSSSWYRLSPDLHVLSARRFPGVGFFRQFHGGLLLVTRQEGTGRIFLLSDQDASFRRILTSEVDDDPQAWPLDRGAVVVFPRAASLHAWWLDQKGRVRHEASVQRRNEKHYYLVGLRVLTSQEAQSEVIRRASHPPATSPELGEPLLPDVDGPLQFGHSQFFEKSAEVWKETWKHDSRSDGWAKLPSRSHISESQLAAISEPLYRGSSTIDYQTWTWMAVEASAKRDRLLLYDDQSGRNLSSLPSCREGENGLARMERVQGLEGLLVRYTCWGQAGRRHWLLNLVPGAGNVRYLPAHSSAVPPDPFLSCIYLVPKGISVWMSPGGEMWQAGPGQRFRRLNPPEPR
jgi:hypothetical protein